jgi:hypothetical protein
MAVECYESVFSDLRCGRHYPAPGPITIGGVSFTLGNFDRGPGAIQAPANGQTFDITGFNFSDAGVAYTIINSAFGTSGSNIGSIEFIGSGGANVTY